MIEEDGGNHQWNDAVRCIKCGIEAKIAFVLDGLPLAAKPNWPSSRIERKIRR